MHSRATMRTGAEILKRLEQANLFVVALDDQGDWYRYHHLFRDFLQLRLNEDPAGAYPLASPRSLRMAGGEESLA